MSDRQHIPAHRPPPEGCAWESADGVPVVIRVVQPPADLGDACPHCRRAYDEPDQGHATIEHLERAFEAGREQGRAEGMREILQRLFQNVSTPQELTERAAALAFAATWPDNEPCPLTVADLASITGVSRRTAERRVQKAKLSHSFPDKHCSECASVSPPPYW